MNGKAARNLRKLIAQEFPTTSDTTYQEINKSTNLYPAGINQDGTTRFQPIEVSTRVLGTCTRALYQRAKRRHYQY